jgi:hypothetical protein
MPNKKQIKRKLIVFFFCLLIPFVAFSQKKASSDTLYQEHSPVKATWLSLIPGAGQIYNRKYWKLPIVYGGFGVVTYFVVINRNEYLKYKEAYKCKVDLGDACDNELAEKYSAENLHDIRNYYRRNMQLSYILGGAWYLLQMLDAVVDAHLYYWDVSDDISLKVEPVMNITPTNPIPLTAPAVEPEMNGLKISVKF